MTLGLGKLGRKKKIHDYKRRPKNSGADASTTAKTKPTFRRRRRRRRWAGGGGGKGEGGARRRRTEKTGPSPEGEE